MKLRSELRYASVVQRGKAGPVGEKHLVPPGKKV
jgi:hypothetical protein